MHTFACKILNRGALIGASLFWVLLLAGQETTFNVHYHFGNAVIQPGGVHEGSDGYLFVGKAVDTIDFNSGWIFGKTDYSGISLCEKRFYDSTTFQTFTFSDIVDFRDGQYLTIGNVRLVNLLAVVINENCDTILTKKYSISNPGQDTIRNINVKETRKLHDGNFVAIATVGMKHSNSRGGVFLFDQNLNLVWYDIHTTNTNHRFSFDEIVVMENSLLLFGNEDDGYENFYDSNFVARMTLHEYTFDGTLINIKKTESSHLWRKRFGVSLTPDGTGYLTSAFRGRPLLIRPEFNWWGVEWSPSIQKFDKDLHLVWERPIGTLWSRWAGSYSAQVVATDETGVVAAGEELVEATDSSYAYWAGMLTKVSWDGDSIWSRRIVADPTLDSENGVFDLETTSDGGYIMAGMAVFYEGWPALIDQHLWLVKTDGYGCVVPGCQTTSTTQIAMSEDFKPLIYPNPASEHTNIYVGSLASTEEIQVEIIDAYGRLVHTIQSAIAETTYIVDVSGWSSGMYVCQFRIAKRVAGRSKLMIVR
ncbi:MAG: hypothetical protein DRI69_08975 [Bacteroidetes bacterium]|nr:MAG: hypothetical protein DRI69_08975 [Bacteroidota bacterium]